MKMKTLAIILLVQFALVYTDVSHLTQNYLPPSQRHMAEASGNDMRTMMTFEQHELQELPEQIEYVQQHVGQKPADAMDQQMLQLYARNMQYVLPILKMQEQPDFKPKMLPTELLTKQMARQQQQWQQTATDDMPQIQHEMLSMQYMSPAIDTVIMHPEQQNRQLYQQQLMHQPEMSKQHMDMLEATRAMNIPAMQQRPMAIEHQQHAEQLAHVLANDGYHYKMVQSEGLLHRLRH